VLEEDDEWGTTTMRLRLLTWLRNFTSAAGRSGVLPGLRVLADALHEPLSTRWPEAVTADYPALARPGSAQIQVPDFWQPEVQPARPDQRPGDNNGGRMLTHAEKRALANRMLMQCLAYSFVIRFACLRHGALRYIVAEHALKGQIADSEQSKRWACVAVCKTHINRFCLSAPSRRSRIAAISHEDFEEVLNFAGSQGMGLAHRAPWHRFSRCLPGRAHE
jgi:hypothetical protein